MKFTNTLFYFEWGSERDTPKSDDICRSYCNADFFFLYEIKII